MKPPIHARTPLASLAMAMLMLLSLLVLPGAKCGGPHRIAHVAILSSGSAVAALQQAHRGTYELAVERVRHDVSEQGGTIGDYEQRVEPLRRVFRARGRALRAMEGALYGAAAINDAVASGAPPSQYAVAAADLLESVRASLAVLEDGTVLPAVRVPRELVTVVNTLASIARTLQPESDEGPAGLLDASPLPQDGGHRG